MSTYRSPVTSCSMRAIGNSGARSSGPTGWRVPGCNTGGGGRGRSGTMLYHRRGISDSDNKIFVVWSSEALIARSSRAGAARRTASGARGRAGEASAEVDVRAPVVDLVGVPRLPDRVHD